MSEVKLKPTGGGAGSISLKAPAATTGNADFPLVLPADDGTSSQYLQTTGSGTLSWATVSSVGGATGVDFNDDVKIRCGGGTDLEIWHNNSDSTNYISSDLGGLWIKTAEAGQEITLESADDVHIKSGSDFMAKFIGDGAVELYHDNAKKFNTTSAGGTLTGDWFLTTGGYLAFPDGVQGIFGTGDDMRVHHTSGVNHVRAANGDLVLGTQTNHLVILGDYYDAAGGGDTIEIWGGSNILPHNNDSIDLGETNHKWDDIYATNSSIQTSDQNTKDNITASDLGLSFINKLSPKSYKFKGKTRTHYGLIAQDIETVLSDISKPTSGFAGFIKTPAPEQLYTERDEAHNRIPSGKAIGDVKLAAHTDYGLRYTEFIGPLVKAVQELSAEVETLKTKVAALEAG